MENKIHCGDLIRRIDDKLEKKANEMFSSLDVTFSQIHMMSVIQYMGGRDIPLKSLEKTLEVAQSTAASTIVRLEKKGFVVSYTPEEDKRLKFVSLTQKGMACCESAESSREGGEEYLLQALNDEERMEFYRLLTIVNDSMK